jgi:hypothetical protein
MSVVLATVIVAFVLATMMLEPATPHRHRRKSPPLVSLPNPRDAIVVAAPPGARAPSPFLLAQAEPAGEDWRPDDSAVGDGDGQFVWSVVAVTTHGGLVYHRVRAGNHREAVCTTMREVSDVARIVGASPVSL